MSRIVVLDNEAVQALQNPACQAPPGGKPGPGRGEPEAVPPTVEVAVPTAVRVEAE
jgi:hypothetical protein